MNRLAYLLLHSLTASSNKLVIDGKVTQTTVSLLASAFQQTFLEKAEGEYELIAEFKRISARVDPEVISELRALRKETEDNDAVERALRERLQSGET